MIYLSSEQRAFFALVQAGLWNKEVQIAQDSSINYEKVFQLSEEQSVTGLVASGKEHVADMTVPKDDVLQFIGRALQLEQNNKAMNEFIAWLIEKLRKEDIYAIIVKGQGIAQCYEKPLWRACGDVDLLLSDNNYKKAFNTLSAIASSIDKENKYNQHLAMTIEGWLVELHGSLRCGLWRSLDREVDDVQRAVFYGGRVRSWMNGRTQVFLPAVDEDVVFVFSHILEHFYKEGIGLRQICDWCRLLWTYREKIDVKLLEERLCKAGIMSEWLAFSALAVEYLGMPVEAMPFYSSDEKWVRKADSILSFVLETGNFGHNRDYSYYKKYPYLVYKAISFWKHIQDFGRYFVIFPLDAIKVTWRRMCVGVIVAASGRIHE